MAVRSRSIRRTWTVAGCIAGLFSSAPVRGADQMVTVPYEKARFVPLDPSRPDGAAIAVLHGDPDKGPSSMLMKMPNGGGTLHTHTSDYDLVLLEGRMKHRPEGQREADAPPLGPGSYWHQPGGVAHGDSCLTDVCVMFITWAGKRDVAVAPEPR